MAQLNQIIWSNITWGACGIFFMCLFGIAIKFEWNSQLTPKAWNRPRNVLKNVLKEHTIFGCWNLYPVTWFLWARKLTYPAGMEGIPGTGTRDDGWSGPTLKMNLDGVILLKFHRMLFKIGVLATLLCCGVLLPTYTSSVCDPEIVTERECQRLASLTDFENLTISRVPEVRRNDKNTKRVRDNNSNSHIINSKNKNKTQSLVLDDDQFLSFESSVGTTKSTPQLLDEGGNIIIPSAPVAPETNADTKWVPGISWRLITTALCSAIIYAYTCYLLWHEWIDNLALRRVYFLESDHYQQRMQELDDIANLQTKPEDPIIAQRPPFVPHPEMREIPPNVSLYSVLYQLPVSLVTYHTDGETQMDRQLVATVNFFNKCVPSQPGFTSSVVAATIIPDAARVAKCWVLWYRLEKKVRMVRYVRKIVRGKLRKIEDGTTDIFDDVAEALKHSNHAMKHAYQKVSQTASAALKSGQTIRRNNSNATASVELTSSTSSDDREEQTPLVDSDSLEENGGALAADGGVDSSACDESDTKSNREGFDDDEGSFWQNIFSGNWKKDPAIKTGDDDEDEASFADEDFINGNGDIEMQKYEEPLNDTNVNEDVLLPGGKFYGAQTHGFNYQNYDVKHYAKTISHNEENELVDIVDGLGIEELSVFAREYAQSSSTPFPLGCFPNSYKILEIDELIDIEEGLWGDIKVLNEQLIEAREYVVKQDDDYEVDSTMIATVASFESGGDGGDRNIVRDDSNSSMSISSHSPKHQRSTLSLRKRGAETVSNQCEKAHEVTSSMKEMPEVAKQIGGGLFSFNSLSSRLALACCGSRYNCFLKESLNSLPKYYGHMDGVGRAFVTALNHPSYAVITFSSRQAAIAARQCLADGGANNSWQQIDDIPIPPLADAPPRNLLFFRGCCRPVTLTINYKEKKCRRWSVYIFLFFFCCFYTIPLAFISVVMNPRWLGQFFPNSKPLHDPDNILYRALAGPASGLATTLFMALLPQIFKFIAYYEGTSSSLEMAERKALLFMWYFMLVTAFFGQYLAAMLIQWYYHTGVTNISQSLWSTVNTVATLIPSAIAPQWLNWIIIRYGFIWPGGYFFQMNTFLTKITRMTFLNRIARGGGAGGPTPYRIYVDSGIVLLCIVGLSPMVPIVAPIATIYFIVVQPMLRWLLIFVYRPRYDTGGERWPLCHQIIISSLIMAQILLSVTLALKGSLGCAVFIGCCTFPTFLFSLWTEDRFLRPYKDTALLQTSLLDGGQDSFSESQREEFRRWLVDCHKASYVPTCLLGSKDNLLTVEPAVVIPKDRDDAGEVPSPKHGVRRRKQKGGIYDDKNI